MLIQEYLNYVQESSESLIDCTIKNISLMYKNRTNEFNLIKDQLISLLKLSVEEDNSHTDKVKVFNINDYYKFLNVSNIYGAFIDSILVGAICLQPLQNIIINHGYIHDLIVLPEYRHRGIGSLLIEHAIEYARDMNYRYIDLEIYKDNIHARDLYSNHGFKTIDTDKMRLIL